MAAWKILQREQVLFADQRYSEDLFLDAYRWMTKQMEHRIESESETVSLFLWAWYQWDGIERRKPDLRSSGHLPKGQRGVRIEFEQSDKGVLLSDFDLWHYVLNYWYLPRTIADGDAFETELSEHNLSFFKMKPLPVRAYHQGQDLFLVEIIRGRWFQSAASASCQSVSSFKFFCSAILSLGRLRKPLILRSRGSMSNSAVANQRER